MRYKLIVSDFDGTLLRSDNTVSPTVIDAIARYRAAGGVFTVSTGRSMQSIVNRLPETGLSGALPIMALQGGYAADYETGKELFRRPLGFEGLSRFAAALREVGLYFHVYTPDGIFTAVHTDESALYEQKTGTTVQAVGDPIEYLKGRDDIIKVLAVCDRSTIRAVCATLQARTPDLQVFTSSPIFIECVSPQAGMGKGVRHAAAALGLSIDEVAAIGDEMNDKTMIEAAGLGVAVKNAVPDLLAVADMTVQSNDCDGVAELIEYCLAERE